MRIGVCVAALLLAPTCGQRAASGGAKEAFQEVCAGCHALETVTSQRRTRAQWQENINSMIASGAKGTRRTIWPDPGLPHHGLRPGAPGGRAARRPAAAATPSRRVPPIARSSTRRQPSAAARSMAPNASPATAPMRAAANAAPIWSAPKSSCTTATAAPSARSCKKGHPTQTTPGGPTHRRAD